MNGWAIFGRLMIAIPAAIMACALVLYVLEAVKASPADHLVIGMFFQSLVAAPLIKWAWP